MVLEYLFLSVWSIFYCYNKVLEVGCFIKRWVLGVDKMALHLACKPHNLGLFSPWDPQWKDRITFKFSCDWPKHTCTGGHTHAEAGGYTAHRGPEKWGKCWQVGGVADRNGAASHTSWVVCMWKCFVCLLKTILNKVLLTTIVPVLSLRKDLRYQVFPEAIWAGHRCATVFPSDFHA